MEKKNRKAEKAAFSPSKARTHKRVKIRRIIFDAFLLVYIIALLSLAKCGFDWVSNYVKQIDDADAQPAIRSAEVFQDLFADPDWEEIFTIAGEEDTLYEGADAYAAYMDKLVGDNTLTYVKTSAGLDKAKEKYIVEFYDAEKDKDVKVAEFTIKNHNPDSDTHPDWKLDEVFVFYTRQESLTIFTVPGHTVFINGVAIDSQEHVISTTHMLVEDYLDEGLHGYRDMTLRFDGLLVQPEVTIQDESGNFMEVTYDPALNLYAEQLADPDPISAELEERVIGAAKSFGRYMINAKDHQLSSYFDKNAKAYQDIILFERWTMQSYQSYDFTDVVVSGYYRYSDTYFSARVSTTLNVTFKSMFTGEISVKPYQLDTTFFIRQNEEGQWLVETMTNVDVQIAIQTVKLEYRQDNEIIATEWVEADADKITLPQITVPNGKEFLGWFTKTVEGLNENYNLVFSPSEDGVIILPENYVLKPMVLYAQFQ